MIELAVITGAKAHDVINFHKLFRGFAGINTYIQHIDDFASSPDKVRDHYDAVLFFFMMRDGPKDDGHPDYIGQPRRAFERLVETGQGIVLLHHALLAYPGWDFWDELVSIKERKLTRYIHDERIGISVADRSHPITQGVPDWTIVDETYLMPDPAGDHKVLLTTNHEQSMKAIAWVHQVKASRVFCIQLGHDSQAWGDGNFKTILKRGITWSCNRLAE